MLLLVFKGLLFWQQLNTWYTKYFYISSCPLTTQNQHRFENIQLSSNYKITKVSDGQVCFMCRLNTHRACFQLGSCCLVTAETSGCFFGSILSNSFALVIDFFSPRFVGMNLKNYICRSDSVLRKLKSSSTFLKKYIILSYR